MMTGPILLGLMLVQLPLLAIAADPDAQCTSGGGTCQDDSICCSSPYVSNLCSGGVTNRCCIPDPDEQCTNRGGTCQDDNNYCFGSYVSYLCSGGASNRCCGPSSGASSACCPSIISRSAWGARPPSWSIGTMSSPAVYVFIHHGASQPCTTELACKAKVRFYQNLHMDTNGWSDIGYNFVVGEDGNAYMGRGWTAIGAHTYGYNSVGIAISVIGDFTSRVPNSAALNTVKSLIACGVSLGHIDPSYTLKGHRDVVSSSTCPGNSFYAVIQSWPHFVAGFGSYTG